ncbi:hypothetical protein C0Q70_07293 [Pomacea canaliculata]|uniref:Uncharacterized protein n=1 Tax=Pomacea canaliculata TaxID=400727 RepID=A0A2T7PEM2_POMCA|nr:uncharacterized protein LOC112562856 [Pomacea canaliculata]PVD31869.1 hypothetical protein C0Q70_07293 [Pomacea canaliculata]
MALTGTKRAITIFGLIFTCLAFVCMIVCFTTPHWLERFPYKRNTKVFVRLGLWEACFNDWQYYKDYLGKRYNGCWWIFHFEYRPVWPWLNPPWLLAVQIMMTLALMLHMTTIVFNILYFVGCCPPHKEQSYVRASWIMNFLAGAFITISSIIFAIKADTDRQWLPNPDSNYLSWSFGFCVLSGFFSLFAAICLLADYMRFRFEDEKNSRGPAYAVKANPKF